MAVQADKPPAVRSIVDLTRDEVDRYNVALRAATENVRGDPLITRETLQAALDATARSLHKLALDRGFYSQSDIQVLNRIVVTKPETLNTVVKRSVIQAIFSTLGWTIAESNPVIGVTVFAIGTVASSDACKQRKNEIYKKG